MKFIILYNIIKFIILYDIIKFVKGLFNWDYSFG